MIGWYRWDGEPQSITFLSDYEPSYKEYRVKVERKSGFKCDSRSSFILRECFICLHYQDLEDISRWENEGGSCAATF